MWTFELHRQSHVLCLGAKVGQAKSERIGTEFFYHVDWIDAVPLRLGHGFAVTVQDLGMDEYLAKRHVPHVVQSGKDHAGHPQRDDVAARD
jgi:hypothetical protein